MNIQTLQNPKTDEIKSSLKYHTMTRHIESHLQRACVGWFRMQYPAIAKLLFAVPNGGRRSKTEAAIMKAEGVTAGVTDLVLLVGRGDYNALCIEIKTTDKKSGLTDNQRAWHADATANGNLCVVCRTVEGFVEAVNKYMKSNDNDVNNNTLLTTKPNRS